MNKKGFTLIELLAVVAILSILIVLAVPNMLNLFNNSTKDAFFAQAQSIYKSAEQQVVVNQIKYMDSNITRFYSAGSDNEKLDLENNNLSYCIKFTNGKISSFKLSDSRYSITVTSITKLEDIKKENITTAITISSC